ncbi:MAG: leucine-rich repeat protein [Muribaculaceae bacterium]|nr:leucine-rich repeat protein [Muribaculaceae bacterium]
MYKIAEDRFQRLCQKYRTEQKNSCDYTHYLKAVAKDGRALFETPNIYQTNELIMLAIETSNKPLHLMTRMALERCISNHRASLKFTEPITEEEHEYYLGDLTKIISFRYDNYFSKNHAFIEKNLYTFIDFFSSVCKYYSGMDTICYVYLYRGEPIPIRIKYNGRKRNFKLAYDVVEKVLHMRKVSADEYKDLWSVLVQKLQNYYGTSSHLSEYCWAESSTEQADIPILQDGEFYENFKTIEENGIIYDYSHSCILSVPKDLSEFTIPEGVSSIPEKCFMGSKTIKKIKFPSTIHHIPKAAFMDCEALEEVDLSLAKPSICYTKMIVGSAAFCNCRSLRNIDMSKLRLEDGAELTFAYCHGIEDISDLKLSGLGRTQMNFFHCENLKIVVRDPYAKYGDFDLSYCNNIQEITISGHTVPAGLLCGCEKLLSVEFTESEPFRKEFGDYCLAGCKSLSKIDTLKGGAQIGKYAFAGCKSLSKFVIHKKDEWYTEISETAFEGCPQVQLEWADESYYTILEPISNYWKRKGIEIDDVKRKEEQNGLKAKKYFLKVLNDYASDKNAIGNMFKERGRFIGMDVLSILKYDVCSWEEYLSIGRLFYESIPYSHMDDDGYIRTALVSWAKSCSVQAYIKAPMHFKFDSIQQIYNILKVSHSYYYKQKVMRSEKSGRYAKIDVLNTFFDYRMIEEKATDEQMSFIIEYTSLSDIRMSYLMQYYLLKHLINYNTIHNNKNWDFSYANNEIDKISNHVNNFGSITPYFLMEVGRTTWYQFIKDEIEKDYKEMGKFIINIDRNEIDFLSFDFSKMEICLKTERITDQ